MKKFISSMLSFVLSAGMIFSAINCNVSAATNYNLNNYGDFSTRTRESVAQSYYAVRALEPNESSWYTVAPTQSAPYQAGRLTTATLNSITSMLNYMRWLVGSKNNIPNCSPSDELQAGAYLRNWQFGHIISRSAMPSDLPDDLWTLGSGADHNIISRMCSPQSSILNFINEGHYQGYGFDTVGHRMFLIGYSISGVSFGYSGSVEMGLVTSSNNTTDLPFLAFPPAGYCPNEVIVPQTSAWTIELNTNKLRCPNINNVAITVTNLNTNASYVCTKANGMITTFKNTLVYAQPQCQNRTYGDDTYRVTVSGLTTPSGATATCEYTTTFFKGSDYIDSAVESVSLAGGLTSVVVSRETTSEQLNVISATLGDTVIAVAADGRRVEIPVSGKWQVNVGEQYFYNTASASSLPAHIVDTNNKLSQIKIPFAYDVTGNLTAPPSNVVPGGSYTFVFNHYYYELRNPTLYQITGTPGNYSATVRGSRQYGHESTTFEFSNLNSSYSGSYVLSFGHGTKLYVCQPVTFNVSNTPAGNTTTTTVVSSDETGVPAFIERLYQAALGRGSDPAGMQDWTNYIYRDGGTGAGMARGFLFSPEFLNKAVSDSEFVDVLYLTFFDRAADPDGKATWVNELAGGASRRSVIEGFINSIEFANLCMRYGIPSGTAVSPTISVEPSDQILAFATRLYTTCLGRNPDPDGLRTWSVAIANRRWSGSQAAHDFFFSPEFISYNVTNEEYVTRLYRTFMGREPDPDGYNMWVGLLNGGGWNREQVFNGFANSAEWNNICMRYGIIK